MIDVKAAYRYSAALRANGTVAIWGDDSSGRPVAPANATNVTAISAGSSMVMALMSDGRVQVWGNPNYVDAGTLTNVPAGATNVIAVAAGTDHCLALRGDGTLVAWGSNFWSNWGQTDVPAAATNVSLIAAGESYNLVRRLDGYLMAWGDTNHYGPIPANATNLTALALGPYGNVLALKPDGTVLAWGNSPSGQTNLPAGLTNVVSIACGDSHCAALRADGTLVLWGGNSYGQTTIPTNLFRFRAVACGAKHTVAMSGAPLVDGIAPEEQGVLAGDPAMFQASVASTDPWAGQWFKDGVPIAATNALLTLSDPQSADSGEYTFTATNQFGFTVSDFAYLGVNGSAVRWVAQPSNQAALPGQPASFTATVAGSEPMRYQWLHNGAPIPGATNGTLLIPSVAPADEGTYTVTVTNVLGGVVSAPRYLAVTLPFFLTAPSDIRARTNWDVSITTGVLSPTPVSYAWYKDGVQLTNETGPSLRFASLQESDAADYVLVAANDAGSVTNPPVHVTVLPSYIVPAEPGVVVNWGNITPYANYTALKNATNAVSIGTGLWHLLASWPDGTVSIWGDPSDLTLMSIPPETTNVVSVIGGQHYSLAIRRDGTTVVWGVPPFSAGAPVPTTTNVMSAALGPNHIMYLRRDGSVMSFPYVTPPNVTNIVAVGATDFYSFALRADGRILIWLAYQNVNTNGPPAAELPGVTNAVSVTGGENYRVAALLKDGGAITIAVATGSQSWTPMAGISNAVQVAAGRGYAALLATGEVSAGGDSSILPVPNGLRAHQISGGLLQVAALTVAPFFDVQPQSQTLSAGSAMTLSPIVRSASACSFQWYYQGNPVPNATNSLFSLAQVRPSQGGTYQLLATNPRAQTWSVPATITVQGLAEILTLSSNQFLLAGDTLNLGATYVANPSASLQWKFNNFSILGATNATLTLTGMTEAMSGNFTLCLSNSFGIVTSPIIQVTVSPSGPRIVTQPSPPPPLPDGSSLQLQVQAVGSQPLAYQWYWNNTLIPGQTQAVLQIPSVSAASDGTYKVQVSNSVAAAVFSDPVLVTTLRTGPSPVIATGNLLARLGRPLRLEAKVGGTAGSVIQWRFKGADVPGETNPVLSIAAAGFTNAGVYTVHAVNGYGSADSDAVQVRVLPNPGPGLVKSWGSVTGTPTNLLADMVVNGYSHGLALLPEGTVQAWGNNTYRQATVPAGLSNVVAIAAGDYFSLALKSDGTVTGWGQNSSGQATPPPGLSNVVAISGGTYHALALKADGSVVAWGNSGYTQVPAGLPPASAIQAGISYSLALMTNGQIAAWGISGSQTNVPASATNIVAIAVAYGGGCGLNSSGLTVPWASFPTPSASATNLTSIAAGYSHALGLTADRHIVAWGSDTYAQTRGANGASNILAISAWEYTTVALSGQPVILASPTNQSVGQDWPLTLQVAGRGTPPLFYQWYFNSQPLAGATNATFTLPAFQSANAGAYTVEVSNPYASARTNFTLTLGSAPAITTQPADQVVTLTSNASFSVTASGTAPMTYQWLLNGNRLLGATASSLTLPYVLFEDNGHVSVLVSNAFGFVYSRDAALQALAPPSRMQMSSDGTNLYLHLAVLQPGGSYWLASSTNLVDWVPVQDFTSPGTNLDLTWPMTNPPPCFYRLLFLNP
ncbi:MAG: immunoglobulin domain-containing protein [Verrucomicrobiota bacterium]